MMYAQQFLENANEREWFNIKLQMTEETKEEEKKI